VKSLNDARNYQYIAKRCEKWCWELPENRLHCFTSVKNEVWGFIGRFAPPSLMREGGHQGRPISKCKRCGEVLEELPVYWQQMRRIAPRIPNILSIHMKNDAGNSNYIVNRCEEWSFHYTCIAKSFVEQCGGNSRIL